MKRSMMTLGCLLMLLASATQVSADTAPRNSLDVSETASGVCDLLSDLLSTAIGDGPLGQHLPIGDAVSLDLQLPACEGLGAAHTDLESASQDPTWGSQDPTWGSQDPTWGFQDPGWAAAEPGWD